MMKTRLFPRVRSRCVYHRQRLRTESSSSSSLSLSRPPFCCISISVLILLIMLLLLTNDLVLAESTNRHRQHKRRATLELNRIRAYCQTNTCGPQHYVPEESLNCVNMCVAPACYDQVFGTTTTGSSPLEDGEIDIPRAKEFEKCIVLEMLQLRKRRRQQQQE